MVKNKSGDILKCRSCNSENLSVYSKEGKTVWIECFECGRIFPVFPEFKKEIEPDNISGSPDPADPV